MPDWKRLVRKRTRSLSLSPAAKEKVIIELSDHLEEAYESARGQGLDERASMRHALQEVGGWSVLLAEIGGTRSEEGSMNHRTKSLWLPALITLLGASLSLTLTQFLGPQPRLVWIGRLGMTFYWPWLASLPFFGAAGAYLSRRAQGPTRVRLAAGLSPALIMLIVMCLILPWGLAIDGLHFLRLVAFGLGLITWVAIPGFALLIGAVPFLRESEPTAHTIV